ncbi:hypothetical protein ABPG74_005207 [Tetrahymena malaccensis]
MQKGEKQRIQEIVDQKFGIETVKDGPDRLGFIANFKTASILDEDMNERTVLQIYYVEDNGNWCKSTILYEPYFYIACERNLEKEIAFFLEKKFENKISKVEIVEKIDLEQINHLSGKKKKYIRIAFKTIQDLLGVRGQLKPKIDKKKQSDQNSLSIYSNNFNGHMNSIVTDFHKMDLLEYISDIREYDVPYHSRVCIDLNIRAGKWFKISFKDNLVDKIICMEDIVERPDLKYLAFDIETSKAELRFPDAKTDCVMMISLMYEGDAYLIVNRDFCGQDVVGFDYAPTPEFECSITVYNEPNEKACIKKFFDIIVDYKAFIITSFNGDKFDWPFIHERCNQLGLSLEKEIGIHLEEGPEYFGRYLTHLDCLYWVIRDAYLPQGSHGLKAVTRSKLGYEPIEVDPEQMVPLARNNTQELAEYSVSDAVATYFIYKKHIHDFIFALCTIIPCYSDEVLRKGSGTLCENLLMTEAFNRNIIFPNKKMEEKEKMHKGHWLDSETYIGGKVECLKSGVFRSDIKSKFKFEKNAFQTLIDNIDKLLDFVVRIEQNKEVKDVDGYEQLRASVVQKLEFLRDVPNPTSHDAFPLIYHLDVAAMYPNIILTNRLQPVAIVNEQICSGCLFNSAQNECKRPLDWQWRGEYFPLNRNEFEKLKSDLEYERAANDLHQTNTEEFYKALKQRIKTYSQKTYKTIHVKETLTKQNTVCMRENSFYIDTVKAFRDRRYTFKHLVKVWKGKADEASKKGDAVGKKEANLMEALYESMQLAHKIILNSFYGYVMRKGARWYSMEMAAMVTHIGSSIISDAKAFVDCVGIPLELDTDGIWCLLPEGFPEDFTIKFKDGKKARMDYPCSILNYLVYEKYCNRQYQTLIDPVNLKYETNLEMSIFFELDGPYRAMIIPAAREEGKLLKKRYVVFNKSGKLTELKGFEIKRRGELNIIKIFQSEIFSQFLAGRDLKECYEACAKVAKKWLNLLKNRGEGLNNEELIDYIGESKVLSKELAEYGEQKGVGITCAKRLKELLGPDIVKGKSLCCNYVMSKKPQEASKAERAIPIQIFNSDPTIKKKFLRKWLKDNTLDDKQLEMREILDWDYYIERLSNTIQKIIIIPAATQGVFNILPDVSVPDWLTKQIKEQEDKFQQQKLSFKNLKITSQQPQSIMQTLHNQQQMKLVGISDDQQKPAQKSSTNKAITHTTKTVSKPKKFVNPYNMNTQFKDFLQAQKYHWIELKKYMLDFNYAQNISTLRQMFSNQDEFVLKSDWHVLQIAPTDQLGVYKLWAFVIETKQIISVSVEIPRVIYVNSLVEYQADEQFKLVKKKLPREKRAYYLYEISKKEEEFHSQFKDFEYFLSNPEIENIYEYHQPLDFKFIVQIGNIIKINQKSIPRGSSYSNYVFKLEQFIGQFGDSKSYLEGLEISNTIIYIAELKMKDRKLWCILNTQISEYIFIMVHKTVDKNKYSKIIRESLPENLVNPQMKIQTYNFDVNDKAFIFIENYLQEIKSKKVHGIILFQTSYTLQNLRAQGIKSIFTEYPCAQLPHLKMDESHYSSLDWQQKGMRFLCQQIENVKQSLENAYRLTEYVQVPICNLSFENSFSQLTDIYFSRLLRNDNCISWYGSYINNREQEYRQLIPSDFLRNEISFSGLYTSHTVEIDIGLLALNTIAHTDELKNIDKETSKLIEYSKGNNKQNQNKKGAQFQAQDHEEIDELTQAKQSFKNLQQMVQYWIHDVQQFENPIADFFITNIHSWLTTKESKFYDPILSKMLQKLMKKIFQYFISKLKGLGAKIVHSTMNKIILDTGKNTLNEAKSYTQYILQTVLGQPLFKVLTLTPQRYFKILLFKDSHNYMALQEIDNDNEETEIEEPSQPKHQVVSNWHISDYLPPKLKHYFQLVVLEYLYKITQQKAELASNPEYANTLTEEIESFCKKYVSGNLSDKLLDAIPELETQYRRDRQQIEKLTQKQEEYIYLESQIIEQQKKLKKTQTQNNYHQDFDMDADYYDQIQQEKEEQQYKKKMKNQKETNKQSQKEMVDEGDDYENQLVDYEEIEDEQEDLEDFIVSQNEQEADNYYSEQEDGDDLNDSFVVDDVKDALYGDIPATQDELSKLKKIMKRDQKKLDELNNLWSFPQLLGGRVKYENSILEFINFLMHVFSLDQNVKDELIQVKRDCLKFLKMNDFSNEAEFKEPCVVIKVADIVCKSCLQVCELDVFRDDWVCQECKTPYDLIYLENKFIELIKNQLAFYQFQDLYCKKCKQIKEDLLSNLCKCSGQYFFQIEENILPIIGTDSKKIRSAFLELAQTNNFYTLFQIIQQIWII